MRVAANCLPSSFYAEVPFTATNLTLLSQENYGLAMFCFKRVEFRSDLSLLSSL